MWRKGGGAKKERKEEVRVIFIVVGAAGTVRSLTASLRGFTAATTFLNRSSIEDCNLNQRFRNKESKTERKETNYEEKRNEKDEEQKVSEMKGTRGLSARGKRGTR